MPARVRVKSQQRGTAKSKSEKTETVILRDEEIVAVLPEGDPLRHALEMPVEDLRSLRVNLCRVLEKRPRVKKVLEAIIEYKEQAGPEAAGQ